MQLAGIAALSATLSGEHDDAAALAALPATIAAALDLESAATALARDHAQADRLLVLARGYEYTARE